MYATVYTLTVSDLSIYTTIADLHQLFQPYGPVQDIKLSTFSSLGSPSLQATITLSTYEGGELARLQLDGFSLLGSRIRYIRTFSIFCKNSDHI
jgi:hypothetical protein